MEEDGDKLFHTHGLSFDSTLDSLIEADYLIDDKDTSFIPPTEAEMSTQINCRVDLSSSEGGPIISELGSSDMDHNLGSETETARKQQSGIENSKESEELSIFALGTVGTEDNHLSEKQPEILKKGSSEENADADIIRENANMLTEEQSNIGHAGIEDSKANEKHEEPQTNSESEELWNIAVNDNEDDEEPVAEIEMDDVVAITEAQPDVYEDSIEQTGVTVNTQQISLEEHQETLSNDSRLDIENEQSKNQTENRYCNGLSTNYNNVDTPTTSAKTDIHNKGIKSLNLDEIKAKRMRKLAEKSSAKQTPKATDKREGECPAYPTFLKSSGKRKLDKRDDEKPSKQMRVESIEKKTAVVTNGDNSKNAKDIDIDKDNSDNICNQVKSPANTNIRTDESNLSDNATASIELSSDSISSDNTLNIASINDTLTEDNNCMDADEGTEIDITDIHNGDIHNTHGVGMGVDNIDTPEDTDNANGTGVESVDNITDTPDDTDNNVAYSGDESSEFDENEIEAWLDEGLSKKDAEEKTGPDGEKTKDDLKPGEFLARDKIVLEEKDVSPFEVLPPGWIQVSHQSGMHVYLHKESRVCTLAKPYNLGPLSVRKHNIPVSAVPCLQYRRALEKEKQAELREAESGKEVESGKEAESENKDTPTTQDQPITNGEVTEKGDSVPQMPVVSMQSVDKAYLETQELTDYCKNLFQFKTVVIKKFRTWREKRVHLIEEKKKRPGLPSNTKLITCPLPEDPNDKTKRRKKDFVLNPVNKSPVCILHEYTQHILRVQPKYVYKEIENWEKPFEASVMINDIKYGSGTGSGKRTAKAEAAKATLLILMPNLSDQFTDQKSAPITKNKEDEHADLSYFEDVPIEDPRVTDLCDKAALPKPYQILIECLRRNFGLGDTKVNIDRKIISNQKTEYSLTVGKHTAKVVCRNKREGKQRASQTMLQTLHPHLKSWATILRLYNNSAQLHIEDQERKKIVADLYMSKSKNFTVLKNLKEAMRRARKDKEKVDQEKPEGAGNLQTIYQPLDL